MLERSSSLAALLVLVLGACEDGPAAGSSNGCTNPDGGPCVLQIAPPSGTVRGGNQVLIVGGGFAPDSSVTFGTLPALETTYLDAQDLLTFAPPSPAGATDVTVENPDGGTVIVPRGYYFTP